jgi:transglutaminase-like putative cysteine protease
VPWLVVERLAEQPGVEDLSVVKRYTERRALSALQSFWRLRQGARMTNGPAPLLRTTEFLDHHSLEVQKLVERSVQDPSADPVSRVIDPYCAVRGGLSYEVYGAGPPRRGPTAGSVLRAVRAFCIHKSIAFAAAARTVGVPSRLVFAGVRNQLAPERLKQPVGGEVFFHALTSVHSKGR